MNNLLFQLHGSMVSWGTSAGDQNRPSDRIPTKSSVLGLVAAAMGVDRSETDRHQELARNFRFGVAVESYGQQMRDYQTTMPPDEEQEYNATRRDELEWGTGDPVITYRAYRVDSLYTVILSSREDRETALKEIQDALSSPHYLLYLGRKSCPVSLPLEPRIYQDAGPLQSVTRFWEERFLPLDRSGSGDNEQPEEFDFYWEGELSDPGSFELLNRRVRRRRDQPVNRDHWIFEDRREEQIRVRRT